MKPTDPVRSYRETQIKTATQGRLILMLYDGAVRHLQSALERLQEERHRYDQVSNDLIKTQDIVSELMVSLDFERGGQVARSLFSLYMYMNRRLLDGNLTKDTVPLEEVRGLLQELRQAWAEVADRASTSPLQNAGASERGVNIAG